MRNKALFKINGGKWTQIIKTNWNHWNQNKDSGMVCCVFVYITSRLLLLAIQHSLYPGIISSSKTSIQTHDYSSIVINLTDELEIPFILPEIYGQ